MNHPRTLLAMAVCLLMALAVACSRDAPQAHPVTTGFPLTSSLGLGDMPPFPPDLLPEGCAVETQRDLAIFETALESGPTLEDLCAVVGPPGAVTGSGLLVVVYFLADGGQLLVSYAGIDEPLVGAHLLDSTSQTRLIFGG